MDKNIKLVLVLVLVGLLGCQKAEKPFVWSDDDKKMVPVLVDLYVSEASLREIRDNVQKDSLKQEYFKQIFQMHHITKEWLLAQETRLAKDPVRLDTLYNEALKVLESQKKK